MSGYPTSEQGNLFGLRNPSSRTNSYQIVRDESNITVISATTAQTIGGGAAGDTHLIGIRVLAALTGTCAIAGYLDGAGAAQSFSLPASTAAGYYDFKGAINTAGALTVTCSNSSDDNLVLVHWRPA